MNDHAAVSRARWAECYRRLAAEGVPQSQWSFHDARVMQQVLADEATGAWWPFAAEGAAVATAPSPAPVAPAPVHAPAVARSRSIWSQAIAEANAEAHGDATRPADPQDDATTKTQHTPPAGSVQRSRSAWGRAVSGANAELLRRGGRVSEG